MPPPPTALFANVPREHGFEPVETVGKLPRYLRGTLYRNGVGMMELFGKRYRHLFEADGAISAFRFEEGQAQFATRITQSDALQQEILAGKHLKSMSASWPSRLKSMHGGGYKNTANTHIVPYQGQLLALMESGLPTEIDPKDLRTIGETKLGGVIQGSFSAHPHRNQQRRTLFNFGFRYGRVPELVVYALPDNGAARVLCRLPIRHPLMVHDFAVSENHIVFFLSPLKYRLWRLLLAFGSFEKNLRWSPELGTEVIIVPIDRPSQVTRFIVDPFLVMHFAGTFEEGKHLVVDYLRYPDASLLTAVGDGSGIAWTKDQGAPSHATLHRAKIDPQAQTFESQPRYDVCSEFARMTPSQEGLRYDTLWLQSESYIDDLLRFQITRIDDQDRTTRHLLAPGQQCSEPVIVERADGRAGSVLSLVFDAYEQKSHLLVLDAQSLEGQAKVLLPEAVPLTFHGSWLPKQQELPTVS